MVEIKICGLRSVADALGCVDAGADALGLNFWSGTPRCVDREIARSIVEAVGDSTQLIGVFVDHPIAEVREIMNETGITWAQLHGGETPEDLSSLLPRAYKALGVGGASVLEETRRYGGEHLLLDAKVPGAMPGGTGKTFDWSLAAEVARERKLTLAGGLRPENVADAIRAVRPFRVDTASGVETEPGVKDLERVRAFVRAARGA